ncbi:MAG: glutamine synthetase, partial [Candidatus Dormibacteraeota bacterium]|nr:glutamine synthetase [Candidatus Dormibacteraeota bacterium]
MTPDAALQALAQSGADYVRLQFVDLFGVLKGVNVPAPRFGDVLARGEWFDGSSVDGFARVLEDDMFLVPDLATMRAAVRSNGRGGSEMTVMCNLMTPEGDVSVGDSRAVLQRVLADGAADGYEFHVGPEVEFFLFAADSGSEPRITDHAGYFDEARDAHSSVREAIVSQLQALGIEVEGSHHEVAFGQHEIDVAFQSALPAADAVVLLRAAARGAAEAHGLRASFMPKPLDGLNGSGMHTHQALLDPASHDNLFHDGQDAYRLSKLARHFIAGQLEHADALAAVSAPLVNSYKRLISGYEAPTAVTWARSSRNALLRVPRTARTDPQATRVELRCPDPSCNPYLAFAAMLAAGLDGVRRELPLGPAGEEQANVLDPGAVEHHFVRALPSSLRDALDGLVEDDTIREALGEDLVDRFVEAKLIEWEQFRAHVSG